MSSVSSRPKPRSTTCAPRSRGAGKTPTSSWRWRWRRRCSRCGKRGAASGKGWPGSTPPSPTSTRSTPRWRPRCGRGRSPTRPCSPTWVGAADSLDQAQQALAIAREVDDPALLARALTACGLIAGLQRRGWPGPYFAEAIGLARALDDRWRLSQILACAGGGAATSRVTRSRRARPPKKDATSPTRSATGSTRASAAFASGWHRYARAIWPEPPHNSASWPPRPRRLTMRSGRVLSLAGQGIALAYQGEAAAARAAADAAIEAAAELGGMLRGIGLRGVGYRGPGRRRCCDGAGRERGGLAAPECRCPQTAALCSASQCAGRAGGRGSGRGPPLGRRGRRRQRPAGT